MKWFLWLVFAGCFLILVLFLIGYFCFRMAMVRYRGRSAKHYKKGRERINDRLLGPYAAQLEEANAWYREHLKNAEEVTLASRDGLTLKASYLENPGSKRTILMMHGYRSSAAFDFSVAFPWFYGLGFNLLVPDQRSHKRSEGKYICYGIKERFDCLDWVHYLIERNGEDQGIILDGMSMGAATVLMTAGLELPPQVKGVMADSGFTSAWDEIGHVIRHDYHLPPLLFQHLINFFAKRLAGVDLREASTVVAMETNRLPILLSHGEADNFVPCEMSRKTVAACRTEKQLITVPGADHGMSVLVDPEQIIPVTNAFLNRHCPPN